LKYCMAYPFLIYIFETFSINQWDKDRIFFINKISIFNIKPQLFHKSLIINI